MPGPTRRRRTGPGSVAPRCRGLGRRGVAAALAVVAFLAVAAPAAPAAGPAGRYPPSSLATFAKLFERPLRQLGLRVQRVGRSTQNAYRPDPHGDKLSVYLQPTGPYTADDYLRNAVPVAQVFLPTIFQRWKGLNGLDLCQEPLRSIDNRREPAQVTQLALTRTAATQISWSRATLATLLAPTQQQPAPPGLSSRDYYFMIQTALHMNPTYQQALLAAQRG